MKYIVFKVRAFPVISQTFITYCIIEAIKNGYEVKIIVDQLNPINESSQEDLLKKYDLLNKVIVNNTPKNKFKRLVAASILLLNPIILYYFLRYCIQEWNFSLSYIFILKFYVPIRTIPTYHVHFANFVSPLFELKKIGFLSANIIVTFHGGEAHLLPKGKRLQMLQMDFQRYANHLTVNSHYLKKILITQGFSSNSIKVIPLGVDIHFFEPDNFSSKNQEILNIITVGRLVFSKGQRFGIGAINILRNRGYKIHYTIVGSGQEYTNLDKNIKKLGLENAVKLLGPKNQYEIKRLLNQHDLFLMPSTIDKKGRREAFGVVSLEAQAMGLPVIGFASGGFPETIQEGETGFIVPEADSTELANAVEKLIKDKKLLKRMSENSRRFVVDNYSISETNNKYLELY